MLWSRNIASTFGNSHYNNRNACLLFTGMHPYGMDRPPMHGGQMQGGPPMHPNMGNQGMFLFIFVSSYEQRINNWIDLYQTACSMNLKILIVSAKVIFLISRFWKIYRGHLWGSFDCLFCRATWIQSTKSYSCHGLQSSFADSTIIFMLCWTIQCG